MISNTIWPYRTQSENLSYCFCISDGTLQKRTLSYNLITKCDTFWSYLAIAVYIRLCRMYLDIKHYWQIFHTANIEPSAIIWQYRMMSNIFMTIFLTCGHPLRIFENLWYSLWVSFNMWQVLNIFNIFWYSLTMKIS